MREIRVKKRAATLINQAVPVKPSFVNPFHFQAGKLHPLTTMFIILLALVNAGTPYGVHSFMAAPDGKITSPAAGSQTGRVVEIEGYTKNIPHDIRNIWLVVEVESLGLCWPKRPIYRPNSPFKTTIQEKGPNKEYTVSLYAVNQICQAEILTWFEIAQNSHTEPGLEMLTGCFKLDSVKLILQNI